jgi:hypothetical protein
MLRTKSKNLERLFRYWRGLLEAQVETWRQGYHVAASVFSLRLAGGESLWLRKHVGLN